MHDAGGLTDVGVGPHGDHGPGHDLVDPQMPKGPGQPVGLLLQAPPEDHQPQIMVGDHPDEPAVAVEDREMAHLP